jgi:exodeoxyribonuclease V alpha subunit
VIVNAHRINRGHLPEMTNTTGSSDFYFTECDDPDAGRRTIVSLVRDRIPKAFHLDPIRDIQVLCPMNRGGLGARALNVDQQVLNPPGDLRVDRFGWTFCPGDKVMQVTND